MAPRCSAWDGASAGERGCAADHQLGDVGKCVAAGDGDAAGIEDGARERDLRCGLGHNVALVRDVGELSLRIAAEDICPEP